MQLKVRTDVGINVALASIQQLLKIYAGLVSTQVEQSDRARMISPINGIQ